MVLFFCMVHTRSFTPGDRESMARIRNSLEPAIDVFYWLAGSGGSSNQDSWSLSTVELESQGLSWFLQANLS